MLTTIDWDLLAFIRLAGRMCEICHERPWTEKNHCIIHRCKGFEKYLDVPENMEFVCHTCHDYPAHTSEHKKLFWRKQIERGYDMEAWWNSLPPKLSIGRAKPI
jgi:hypothetical protein